MNKNAKLGLILIGVTSAAILAYLGYKKYFGTPVASLADETVIDKQGNVVFDSLADEIALAKNNNASQNQTSTQLNPEVLYGLIESTKGSMSKIRVFPSDLGAIRYVANQDTQVYVSKDAYNKSAATDYIQTWRVRQGGRYDESVTYIKKSEWKPFLETTKDLFTIGTILAGRG